MSYPIVFSQQKFIDQHKLSFPFEERGLQFGDGVYEVIRIYQGVYYLLTEHIDRFYRSAEAIRLEIPLTKEQLTDALNELLTKNKMQEDGKTYLQITRGSAPRDHSFPTKVNPNMYAYLSKAPRPLSLLQSGVSVISTDDIRWENCFIKSLNLLPNVLAKQTASEYGCYEAILHKNGLVTECSAANVYLVKDEAVYTFPSSKQILHGCVRMRIEQFTHQLDIPFIEDPFTLQELYVADEVFLTSSTSEVMPIIKVDQKEIANGKPGSITRKLQEAYERDIKLVINESSI